MQKQRHLFLHRLFLYRLLAGVRFAAESCPAALPFPVRSVFSGSHSTQATAVTNWEEALLSP